MWLRLLGTTIAHSQAQWHSDPHFPLLEIMISKVTSFSCAIVNILVSPIPVEGAGVRGGHHSANLSEMVITHLIVQDSAVDVEQLEGGA